MSNLIGLETRMFIIPQSLYDWLAINPVVKHRIYSDTELVASRILPVAKKIRIHPFAKFIKGRIND